MAHDVVRKPAASPGAIITPGVSAGVIGGIAMAIFEMMYALITMGDLSMPLRLMGATFYGPQALVGGIGVLMWGLMVHMMTSAVLGVIFTWIVSLNVSSGAAAAWGIGYGLVVMFVMIYLVLPWANPTMAARVPMMMGAQVIGHVLYGMCLGLAPGFIARSEQVLLD